MVEIGLFLVYTYGSLQILVSYGMYFRSNRYLSKSSFQNVPFYNKTYVHSMRNTPSRHRTRGTKYSDVIDSFDQNPSLTINIIEMNYNSGDTYSRHTAQIIIIQGWKRAEGAEFHVFLLAARQKKRDLLAYRG